MATGPRPFIRLWFVALFGVTTSTKSNVESRGNQTQLLTSNESKKWNESKKKSKLKKTSWPRDVGPLVRLLSCNTTKLCQPGQPNWWSHPLVHASVEKLWTAIVNVILTSLPSCSIVEKRLLELVLLVKLSASLSNVFRRRFLRDRNTCPSWLLTLVVLLCGSYSSWHVCCFQKIAWKHKDVLYPGNDKWHSYLLQAPI